MKIEILNKTRSRIPKQFIKKWITKVLKILKKKNGITIVFVTQSEIQKLNKLYRRKNKPTDILSFSPVEKNSLGELVLCLPVLKKQAKEQQHSLNHEIGYMLIHGVLHLLGHDHEKSKSKAKKMFALQDKIHQKVLR